MLNCNLNRNHHNYEDLKGHFGDLTDMYINSFNDPELNYNIDKFKKHFLDTELHQFALDNPVDGIYSDSVYLTAENEQAVEDLNKIYHKKNGSNYTPYIYTENYVRYNYDIDFNAVPSFSQIKEFARNIQKFERALDDQAIFNHLRKSVDHLVKRNGGSIGNFDEILFEGPRANRHKKSFKYLVKKAGWQDLVIEKEGKLFIQPHAGLTQAYKDMLKEVYTRSNGINSLRTYPSLVKSYDQYLPDEVPPELIMFSKDQHVEAVNTNKWLTSFFRRKILNQGIRIEEIENFNDVFETRYGYKIGGSAYTNMVNGYIGLSKGNWGWMQLGEEALHYMVMLSWKDIEPMTKSTVFLRSPEYVARYEKYKTFYTQIAEDLKLKGENQRAEYYDRYSDVLALQEVVVKTLLTAINGESSVFRGVLTGSRRTYKLIQNAKKVYNWIHNVFVKLKKWLRLLTPSQLEEIEYRNVLAKWAQAVLSDKEFNEYSLRFDVNNPVNSTGGLPSFSQAGVLFNDGKVLRSDYPSSDMYSSLLDGKLQAGLESMDFAIKKLYEQKYNSVEYTNPSLIIALSGLYRKFANEQQESVPDFLPVFNVEYIKTVLTDMQNYLTQNPNADVKDLVNYMADERYSSASAMTNFSSDSERLQFKALHIDKMQKALTYVNKKGHTMDLDRAELVQMFEEFIDYVVINTNQLKVREKVRQLQNTIREVKNFGRQNENFIAMLHFLAGTEVMLSLDAYAILDKDLKKRLDVEDYKYISRQMDLVEQSNPDVIKDELYKVLIDHLEGIVIDPNTSTKDRVAVQRAFDVITQYRNGMASWILNGINPVTKHSEYVYMEYTGGLYTQVSDLWRHISDNYITNGSYDGDKVSLEDYGYIENFYNLFNDVTKHIKSFYNHINNKYADQNIENIKALIDIKTQLLNSIDPIDPAYNLVLDEIDAQKEILNLKEQIKFSGILLGAETGYGRKSIESYLSDLKGFMENVFPKVAVKIVLKSSNPFIKDAPDEQTKKIRAKAIIENQLEDSDSILAHIFPLSGINSTFMQLARLEIENTARRIKAIDTEERFEYEDRVAKMEADLRNNPVVKKYMNKYGQTYIGGLLHERDNKGNKTGYMLSAYNRRHYYEQFYRIDNTVLDIAEEILAKGTVSDSDVTDIYVPTHLKKVTHFGRAGGMEHEYDRDNLLKFKEFDEVIITLFINNRHKELSLSKYLRYRKALMLSEINREPTEAEKAKNEQTLQLRRLQYIPMVYEDYRSQNVYDNGRKRIYMGELAIPSDDFINQDFAELYADPEFKAYYDFVSEFYRNTQRKLGPAYVSNWLKLPQRERTLDDILSLSANFTVFKNPVVTVIEAWTKAGHLLSHIKDYFKFTNNDLAVTSTQRKTVGPDKIPLREPASHFLLDVDNPNDLRDNVIDSIGDFNTMVNRMVYSMQDIERLDALSRVIMNLPWVRTLKSTDTLLKIFKPGTTINNPEEEYIHRFKNYSDGDLIDIKENIVDSDLITPNKTLYGSKPDLVSKSTSPIPYTWQQYERSLEVMMNGHMTEMFYGPRTTKTVKTVLGFLGYSLLAYNLPTIAASAFAAYAFLQTRLFGSLAIKDKSYLGSIWYVASTFGKVMGRSAANLSLQFFSLVANSLGSLSPFGKPVMNQNLPLGKVDYIHRIAQIYYGERNAVSNQQHYFAETIGKVLGWGAWQATEYNQNTFGLVSTMENYRYSAEFEAWLTHEQYVNNIRNRFKIPLKQAQQELKDLYNIGNRAQHQSRITELESDIKRYKSSIKNVSGYHKLPSFYDSIQFSQPNPYKNKDSNEILNIQYSTKPKRQRLADGGYIDVIPANVVTDKDFESVVHEARRITAIADGKHRFKGEGLADNHLLYRAFMQMKTWVFTNFFENFRPQKWDEYSQRYISGFYPAMIRTAVHMGTYIGIRNRNILSKDNVAPNAEDYSKTLHFLALTMFAQMMFVLYRGMDNDCKKEGFPAWLCSLKRLVTLRTAIESMSYAVNPALLKESFSLVLQKPFLALSAADRTILGFMYSAVSEGTSDKPNKKVSYQPKGPNEFVLLGPLNRRDYKEWQVQALQTTPVGAVMPWSNATNINSYMNGILKFNPALREQIDQTYNYFNTAKDLVTGSNTPKVGKFAPKPSESSSGGIKLK